MAEIRTALDAEHLLANADWLRVLAGRVLRDESEVDDLVHEAWVAALRRPAEEVDDLPSWLAAVVRNLSHRRLKTRSRQESLLREKELALEDGEPDPATAYDLEHARRRVVDAVLALPDPFRSTILLAFFEGLAPQEIARRVGVPAATVRTRLRRALLRLRHKLGAEGGPGSACAGLILLALPAPPAPVIPRAAALPRAGLPLAAKVLPLAATVLALVGLAWWGGGRGAGDATEPDSGPRTAGAAPATAAERALPEAPPEALAPRADEGASESSLGEDFSRCGGGPLGLAGELVEEAGPGDLPQPALRSGGEPARRTSRQLALARELPAVSATAEPPAPLRVALARAPRAAATRAAASSPLHVAHRGAWSVRLSDWSGRRPDKDEDEDEQGAGGADGGGPGTRHNLSGGEAARGLGQRAKPRAEQKGPGSLPSASEMALEAGCVCRKAAEGSRLDRDPARRVERERLPQPCPVHALGPDGPRTAVAILETEELVVLLELTRGEAEALLPLPRTVVVVERPRRAADAGAVGAR